MPEQNKEEIKKIIKRFDLERSNRGQLDRHLEDISLVMSPLSQGFVSDPQQGERRNDEIFDGTGMQAKRSLTTTLGAMIRPEGEVFATIKAEDDKLESNEEAAKWLGESTELLDEAIRNPQASFRQSAGEVDDALVGLGTGVMFIGKSQGADRLFFKSLPLSSTYPVWNEESKVVITYRIESILIWQAADMFGLENIGEKAAQLYQDNKLDNKIKVLNVVMPRNQMRLLSPRFKLNMPFANKWINMDETHLISEGGHMEFPLIAPRWDTSSGDPYGHSPGMVALPDVNTSQAIQETMLVAGQRNADPAIFAPNDGSFDVLNTFPGAISYYDVETAVALGGNPFFPMNTGANLPLTRDMQKDTRELILSAFFKNILNLPVDGPEMTATEIIQRKDEFIRELGAVFGRLETDYNHPIAQNSFLIMLRAGAFGEIPEVLQGQNVKFEFELPATKIRKQVQAAAGEQWARTVMEFSKFNPDVRHLVNLEALARNSHNALVLSHEIINSKEKVEEMVSLDRQREAQLEQAAALQQLAETADKGTKAVKNLGLENKEQPQEAAVA